MSAGGCDELTILVFNQRVKVYRLNDGGKWDDKGTGHVSLEYLEVSFCLWKLQNYAGMSNINRSPVCDGTWIQDNHFGACEGWK